MLTALATRQLPEDEARRLTLHLTECAGCRQILARLASRKAVPTLAGAALAELLAERAITDSWREWIRGLVGYLPPDDEDFGVAAVDGYEELSPLRIDDLGRLIVELAPVDTVPPGKRVHLALMGDGSRLDLCDVAIGPRGLYAVVDLSALDPRPGLLRSGTLAAEPVRAAAAPPTLLSELGAIQDEALYGTEFWDRFAPITAIGDRLTAQLAHEIAAAEGDLTTRAPRLRSGQGLETDRTPTGRVQYALNALEEYATLWHECNGTPLEGAADCARRLRAAISPSVQAEVEQTVIPASKPAPVEDTIHATPVQRVRKETP
jgi:hypothetical protein